MAEEKEETKIENSLVYEELMKDVITRGDDLVPLDVVMEEVESDSVDYSD